MHTGLQEIVVVVEDIARMRAVFLDVCRWSASPLPDAPAEQFSAWRLPESCSRIEQMLLVPEDEQRGVVRLVRFHGVEQALMRPSQHTWDSGGIFDIDVYVRDARKTYRELQRHGWTAFGPPTDYDWSGFSVCEVLAVGPDGVVLALLQPYGQVLVDLPQFTVMSRAFNSTQIVRDYDATMRFYLDILGWKAMVDSEVVGAEEPGRNVLGIPGSIASGVRRRVAIVHPEGTNDGSIEFLEMAELAGDDFSDRCVAPNLGFLSARFPVADADRYANELVGRGAELYVDPLKLDVTPYGATTTFSIRTPDGVILEFYSVD
jgi:catechol 2,3-dioxygenase-like lactoylglutathione lyase family enzyme